MYGDVQAKLHALGTSALSVQIDALFASPPGGAQWIGDLVDTTAMDNRRSTPSPLGIYSRFPKYPARSLVTTLTELTSSSIEVSDSGYGRGTTPSLSPWRPWFHPSIFHVGFVMDKVALGQIFLRVFRLSSASTGLFISPSGISELDCATTKTDTAERSISIGRDLSNFFLY